MSVRVAAWKLSEIHSSRLILTGKKSEGVMREVDFHLQTRVRPESGNKDTNESLLF
jgi:hypothetical protein